MDIYTQPFYVDAIIYPRPDLDAGLFKGGIVCFSNRIRVFRSEIKTYTFSIQLR